MSLFKPAQLGLFVFSRRSLRHTKAFNTSNFDLLFQIFTPSNKAAFASFASFHFSRACVLTKPGTNAINFASVFLAPIQPCVNTCKISKSDGKSYKTMRRKDKIHFRIFFKTRWTFWDKNLYYHFQASLLLRLLPYGLYGTIFPMEQLVFMSVHASQCNAVTPDLDNSLRVISHPRLKYPVKKTTVYRDVFCSILISFSGNYWWPKYFK